MYKRRRTGTQKIVATPSRVTTSTQQTQIDTENDSSRINFPMSAISVDNNSQKRKETLPVSNDFKKQKTSKCNSHFEEIVTKAGCIFEEGDNPHVLTQDQAVFVRDLTSHLIKNPLFPKNIDDFFSGFETYCSNNSNLKKILTHTKTSPGCKDARGSVQESLVRLLLSVDCLQPKISEFLLEKVAEFALISNDDPDSADDVPWIRIILRQLRLLDHVVDGSMLNERLFSVLEVAPLPVQHEIIFCLPDIISDEQHHDAALRLSKLLKSNFQLTAAIMEALDNLSLQQTLRVEVCGHMLQALSKAPPEFLPAIITFLVSSEGEEEHLTEVVAGLRKKLDLNPSGGLDSSNQVLILSALSSGALSCRKIVDIWLKAICTTHSSAELTPLDMAVLLLLHHSLPGRRKQIYNIMRNRIKAGVITGVLVEKTFTILLAAIKEYVKSALQIATVLFRSPDLPVQYIGKTWFKLMLTHLEGHLSQSVVLELLLLIGTGGMAIATSALGIMSDMERCHLQSHIVLLMGLLDNIHDMDLIQVGKVMDLLCGLIYGEDADTMHHDEIHMMIRKHLSSSNNVLKQKGVVGAVMALKHMATSDSESPVASQSSSSSMDSSNLIGRAGRAKELLELVMESIQNSVLCIGLLYDQLATAVCSCSNLDATFLKWIADKTVDKFQDNYVNELKIVNKNRCPQFSLESPDEEDEDAICLDIEGVLKLERSEEGQDETGHPLCVMAPLFRLLRSLQFRISNSLESVDGLLGCAIAMPKHLDDLIDDFPGLTRDEQIIVLDCLFYCINWFRELINAFSLLREPEMQLRVLLRIENTIALQRLLARGLSFAKKLDYNPPRCHFYTDVKQVNDKSKRVDKKATKGKGKGKGKKKKDAPDTSVANATTSAADEPPAPSNEVDRNIYRCYFRELEMEVFTALSRNFMLDKKEIKQGDPALYPTALLFLLEDYVAKLDHCLPNTAKRISSLATSQQAAAAASVGFANLERIAVPLVARRAVKLLPFIIKKLEITAEYCQELLDENDGMYDGPEMFKDGSEEIKLCYGMLLHSVASTVGWSGFHSSANNSLLRDCLRVIASRQNNESMTVTSIKMLVLTCCEYFAGYTCRTVHLTSAENLVRVMQVLSSFVPAEEEPKKKLADMCHDFLSRQWHTLEGLPESGATYNRQVESLVKSYFLNVPNQLKVVESTANWVESEIKDLKGKDSYLKTFPTITKSNFPILYRNLWQALGLAIEYELEAARGRTGAKFKIWTVAADVMSIFTNVVKRLEHRMNHQAYIKHSQVVLKLFLSDGMPVLETLLKSKRENVPGMLKVLQVTTRYLHALCISTKQEKMQGLTAYVPVVRKTLETLIFRVKAMLVANNCSDAFWMGNLKNKTIRGDEVLSQSTVSEDQNEEEEEEELPEDENSDADLDNETVKNDGDDDDDEEVGDDEDNQSDSEIL